MTTPVPTRFSDEQLQVLDRLVADGIADNRSDVIRLALNRLDESVRRASIGKQIADSYRTQPQTEDEDAAAMANAVSLTEAEPW